MRGQKINLQTYEALLLWARGASLLAGFLLSLIAGTANALTHSTLITRADFRQPGPQASVVGIVVSHHEKWSSSMSSTQDDFCTAVILDAQTILTAAHCLAHTEIPDFRSQMRAFIGTSADDRSFGYDENFDLSAVHLNPKYNPKASVTDLENLKHDLAIVKLRKALPARSIPVKLPDAVQEQPLDQEFILLGYGTDRLNSTTAADVNAWGHLRIGHSHFATWNPLKNSYTIDQQGTPGICKGDSGGPALRQTSQGYELVAIARNVNVDAGKLTPSQRQIMNAKGVGELMNQFPDFDICQQTGSLIDLRQDLPWIQGFLSPQAVNAPTAAK